jgi:hypothetical protein
MIRFKAPVPSDGDVYSAALSGHYTGKLHLSSPVSECHYSPRQRSSPTLILLRDKCYEQHMAVPESNCFTVEVDDEEDPSSFNLMRLAISGGILAADDWQRTLPPFPAASANKIFSLMKLLHIDPYKLFDEKLVTGFADLPGTGETHFFLVESAGELLAIVKLQEHLKVFRLDNVTESDELEPLKSIGDCAIFVGYSRCLSVSTEKFPSIVANCIYYLKSTDYSLDIYQYELDTGKDERVSEAIDSLNPITLSFASPPFTIVQLFSSYTFNDRESQLWMERLKKLDLVMERFKQQDPDGYLCALQLPDLEDCSYSDLDLDDNEFSE